MSLDDKSLDSETRKRLYGKKSTIRDWINEVIRLKLGDARRHQAPMKNGAIAEKLGVSRQWIIDLIKLAIKNDLVESDPSNPNQIKLPDRTVQATHFERYQSEALMQDSLVREWVDDMMTRRNGQPIKIWRAHFNKLKNLINTLKIKPEQLILDHKTTEMIMKNFAKELQLGNYDKERVGKKILNTEANRNEHAIHMTVMAVRDFCGVHHLTWRRGVGGIMSGKVVGHGKYPDIKLTTEEIQKALDYILNKWGLDSDILRFFAIAIDTCARQSALMTMKLNFTEHISSNNKLTLIMEVIETKTEHLNGGKWTKYIRNPLAIESIRLARARGQMMLWNDLSTKQSTAEVHLSKQLKEIYTHLGKQDLHEGYMMRKPFHSLRHIGAQKLLDETNFNYGLVCKIGGWHTAKELEDSYGKMPAERVLKGLDEL